MYKFRNHHSLGARATYIKQTQNLYYCRVSNPDGSNTFHYSYVDDPGGNEFELTEQQYKAVRGIRECLFFVER